jgi:hypothetical protein
MISGGSTLLLDDLIDLTGVDTGEDGAELFGVFISGVLDPASDPSRSSTALAATLSTDVFSRRA